MKLVILANIYCKEFTSKNKNSTLNITLARSLCASINLSSNTYIKRIRK